MPLLGLADGGVASSRQRSAEPFGAGPSGSTSERRAWPSPTGPAPSGRSTAFAVNATGGKAGASASWTCTSSNRGIAGACGDESDSGGETAPAHLTSPARPSPRRKQRSGKPRQAMPGTDGVRCRVRIAIPRPDPEPGAARWPPRAYVDSWNSSDHRPGRATYSNALTCVGKRHTGVPSSPRRLLSASLRRSHPVAHPALVEDVGGAGRPVTELPAELLHERADELRV